MHKAIMYDPAQKDNFYYIVAEAKEMKADLTEVRRFMETANFAFYIVATNWEGSPVTQLEAWYLDTFNRTWKFTTKESHYRFMEVETV